MRVVYNPARHSDENKHIFIYILRSPRATSPLGPFPSTRVAVTTTPDQIPDQIIAFSVAAITRIEARGEIKRKSGVATGGAAESVVRRLQIT